MKNGRITTAGLAVLFFVCAAAAQPWWRLPLIYTLDTWNSMWLGQSNNGMLGGGNDPCSPRDSYAGCEMPPGSGAQYLEYAALWIGAIIDDPGGSVARVSTATDCWLNPSINEFWPSLAGEVFERSLLDTVNCHGESIYDPAALSHHDFEMTFNDTVTNRLYVEPDPIDGPHRPLGLKVVRTVYSTFVAPCSYSYWIKYRIENIGTYPLRNVFVGHYLPSGVWAPGGQSNDYADDVAGFEPSRRFAYIADNDGRYADDDSGNDFVVPHVAGFMYLPRPGDPAGESFNWWISNGDPEADYGPSWQDAPDWSGIYGTPMGDARKYHLLPTEKLTLIRCASAMRRGLRRIHRADMRGGHRTYRHRLTSPTASMSTPCMRRGRLDAIWTYTVRCGRATRSSAGSRS